MNPFLNTCQACVHILVSGNDVHEHVSSIFRSDVVEMYPMESMELADTMLNREG